jgi:hypothetical protein
MKQNWTERELVEFWTLSDSEKQLLEQRTESGRLGYAVLIKFFQIEGRFPLYNKEAPWSAVDFLADQLNSPASVWLDFPLKGPSSERARSTIRSFLGFRSPTNEDSQQLQAWLTQHIVPLDQDVLI